MRSRSQSQSQLIAVCSRRRRVTVTKAVTILLVMATALSSNAGSDAFRLSVADVVVHHHHHPPAAAAAVSVSVSTRSSSVSLLWGTTTTMMHMHMNMNKNQIRGGGGSKTSSRRMMVRNIDLPEALIFYGADTVVQRRSDSDDEDDGVGVGDTDSSPLTFQPGVQALLKECRDIETPAIVIVEQNDHDHHSDITDDLEALLFNFNSNSNSKSAEGRRRRLPFRIHQATQDAPNPRDVWEAIHHDAATIQPKGFGGSSGFGRKLADPVRSPLPARTVVLCSNEQQCRAGIYAGMRVICLREENDISDAVVDSWEDIQSLDDVATPGSFWLNPPHARDDQNNAVDPLEVMLQYEHVREHERERKEAVDDLQENKGANVPVQSLDSKDSSEAVEDMPDDELARILADMD